jgi:hypothetical protein
MSKSVPIPTRTVKLDQQPSTNTNPVRTGNTNPPDADKTQEVAESTTNGSTQSTVPVGKPVQGPEDDYRGRNLTKAREEKKRKRESLRVKTETIPIDNGSVTTTVEQVDDDGIRNFNDSGDSSSDESPARPPSKKARIDSGITSLFNIPSPYDAIRSVSSFIGATLVSSILINGINQLKHYVDKDRAQEQIMYNNWFRANKSEGF